MPTGNEFSRVDLGSTKPTWQGEHGPNGVFSGDEYTRVDTAGANDPSANLRSSTFRPGGEPDRFLDTQAREVQAAIDGKHELDLTYGLAQPQATLGSHTFLRDEREYGNEQDDPESKIPFQGKR
jgi:hypothetical protein